MNIKTVLPLFTGLILGTGLGALITRKYFQTKAEMEVEDFKEYCLSKVEESDAELFERIGLDVPSDKEKVDFDERDADIRLYKARNPKPSLEDLANQMASDIEQEKEFVPDPDPMEPLVITLDEFVDPRYADYETADLYWYGADAMLIDEENRVVPNAMEILGETAVLLLREDELSDSDLYVRDERNKMAYCVHVYAGEYVDTDED